MPASGDAAIPLHRKGAAEYGPILQGGMHPAQRGAESPESLTQAENRKDQVVEGPGDQRCLS